LLWWESYYKKSTHTHMYLVPRLRKGRASLPFILCLCLGTKANFLWAFTLEVHNNYKNTQIVNICLITATIIEINIIYIIFTWWDITLSQWEYEDGYLLGCCTVQYGRKWPIITALMMEAVSTSETSCQFQPDYSAQHPRKHLSSLFTCLIKHTWKSKEFSVPKRMSRGSEHKVSSGLYRQKRFNLRTDYKQWTWLVVTAEDQRDVFVCVRRVLLPYRSSFKQTSKFCTVPERKKLTPSDRILGQCMHSGTYFFGK
jgi:hypothetical protein